MENTEDTKAVVKQVDLNKADELMGEMFAHTRKHLPKDLEGWVFRGQMDASWNLEPSVFRKGALDKYQNLFLESGHDKWQALENEMAIIDRFAAMVDSHGFQVPGNNEALRTTVSEARFDRLPHTLWEGVYALAQHYGVPTRLLDWSHKTLVGAYFACNLAAEYASDFRHGTSKQVKPPTRFAFWALNRQRTESEVSSLDIATDFIAAPAALIPNLKAQAGLFSVLRFAKNGAGRTPNSYRPPDLNLWLEGQKWSGEPLLYKFTLPIGQAGRLLAMLADADITAATVFPGLHSLELAMYETTLHRP